MNENTLLFRSSSEKLISELSPRIQSKVHHLCHDIKESQHFPNKMILLHGNHGTGKSSVAKYIANICTNGKLIGTYADNLLGTKQNTSKPQVGKVMHKALNGVLYISNIGMLAHRPSKIMRVPRMFFNIPIGIKHITIPESLGEGCALTELINEFHKLHRHLIVIVSDEDEHLHHLFQSYATTNIPLNTRRFINLRLPNFSKSQLCSAFMRDIAEDSLFKQISINDIKPIIYNYCNHCDTTQYNARILTSLREDIIVAFTNRIGGIGKISADNTKDGIQVIDLKNGLKALLKRNQLVDDVATTSKE